MDYSRTNPHSGFAETKRPLCPEEHSGYVEW